MRPLDRNPKRHFDGIVGFKTKVAFESVKCFVHSGLASFIDEETETRLRESEPDFIRPYLVVVAYLEALQTKGLLFEAWCGWTACSRLAKVWEKRRDREEEKTCRSDDVIKTARSIIAKLPEAERRGFDVMAWFRRVQPAFGCSFANCIERSDPRFGTMKNALVAVDAMIVRGSAIVDQLLGLPLQAQVARQVRAREIEQEERARRAILAADERVRQITVTSINCFGSSTWAETPNPALGGATPRGYARESSERLNEVIGEVVAERRRRQARAEAEQRKATIAARKRSQLVDAVRIRLTEDRAGVFLNSAHPKIGRRRTIDYCIDEMTLETCLSLLDSVSSRR